MRALKETLTPLLLFAPTDPGLIFQPPSYRALAPLPTSIVEVAQSPRTVIVPHSAILHGHRKLIIAGTPGAGRTVGLIMNAWQVTETRESDRERPYARTPVWINLSDLTKIDQDAEATALENLVEMATVFLPGIADKWLLRHLKGEPTLLLLDNWESLDVDQHDQIAKWISEADTLLPDAVWVVAASPCGYGALVERGFVAAELLPTTDRASLPNLYRAWSELQGTPIADGRDEEILESLAQALDEGAPLWEIHTRIVLHLATGALPTRQAEVLAQLLNVKLAAVDLGRGCETIVDQAAQIAAGCLVALIAPQRLEGRKVSNQDIRETIKAGLPPKEERSRQLEGAARQQLTGSGILRQEGKAWVADHSLWADYLAAVHLAEAESGGETVRAHIDDPGWSILSELYAGLADAGDIAAALVTASETERGRTALLRAARWARAADPEQAWRKTLIKVLAQTFMQLNLDTGTRLNIGRSLTFVAGPGARAFFLKMLQQRTIEIRCAALRGLGWTASSRDMPLMGAALQDSDPQIQRSAVRALADLGTPSAVAFLSDNLPQVNETLMLVIAEILAWLPEGWQALEEHALHSDLMVRRAAALGPGKINEPWAEERLLEIAREDLEWLVRSAAEAAIQAREEQAEHETHVSPPPEVDQMDWLIAWAARQGQGLGVGQAAVETLLQAARQGNVDARILSALTLAHIGRKSDLLAVETLVRDLNPAVQEAAVWAAEGIKRRYRFGLPAT
ncbi:MAG: HEAT repeat domain-containing protein [Anaerolineae bacterium]|nr:HEAT repeat domain-containing protein [Anaerolineae bacterium]